ncbi:RNA polymerase sigma-70 factor [Sphingobacterium sp. lm-10]|uniref:RNA polymerase sigma-70 factor n=1 Tax=Sphingobacterium sp. lm-10 TaxID=2944904 RepID=UPI0020204773|nr:RNA polymerase sigma-70 factor [Sphingobacterium sp. lm-10]MCL7988668.1 RNA polymerase sigma-70 factor [Sphingobacterium sp. lm-10]
MSDWELLAGLKAGDNRAYKNLYDTHYYPLCVYANRIIDDEYYAQTIVNDVFFGIWQNRAGLAEIQALRPYLLRSIRNRCITHIKQETKRRKINQRLPISQDEDMDAAAEDNTISKILASELDLKIASAIKLLPALTREIFTLSRFGDMKYVEIADHLNVSVDVVKYHIKQALAHLRRYLQEYF